MKIILITGASSGLGLSHAVFLARLGYMVIGTSRDADTIDLHRLEKIYRNDHTRWRFVNKAKTKVRPIRSLVPKDIDSCLLEILKKIKFFTLDVASNQSVRKSIDEIEAFAKSINGKGVDVLINNAGIGFFGSIIDLPIDKWQKSFETNFFGSLRVVKAVAKSMKKRKSGQIINTSSIGGLVPIPFQVHYSTTKAALKIMNEGLRIELNPFNVKVSSILPSDVNTSFNRHTLDLALEKSSELDSYDISALINNMNLNTNSLDYERAKRVWIIIIKNLIVAPPPIIISRKIAKIIDIKNPKINYKVGDFSQILFLSIIKKFFSDDIACLVLSFFYKAR